MLVAPLPYAVRKRFFRFLSESPLVAKLAYALKITFMCAPPQFRHKTSCTDQRQIHRGAVHRRAAAHVARDGGGGPRAQQRQHDARRPRRDQLCCAQVLVRVLLRFPPRV